MATTPSFVCRQCDYRSPKWLGRCPECSSWGSIAEAPDPTPRERRPPAAQPRSLKEIDSAHERRLSTGISELDRVLGGGLVPGVVVLLAGEPGIGKSTLLLQAASEIAATGRRVLYVSGEESATQLRSRSDRLGVVADGLLVVSETDTESIVEAARLDPPGLLAVDSIQAVQCAGMGSVPGSVGQVRESAARFVDFAKATDTPVVLIGHVTKEGSVAGPRTLEHVVDAVVQFEGDRHHEHRLLRSLKNRFGPASELGVFEMTAEGLRPVTDPGDLFLSDREEDLPGSAVLAAVEGTRPLLVEIQALVGEPIQGTPRRTALGIDPSRMALILAVLQRRLGLDLGNRDVFVNVTGGISVDEPAADLAVAAAVISSSRRRPVISRAVIAGEIGLTGEVRGVSRLDLRLREASRRGFETAVVPERGAQPQPVEGLRLRRVRHVGDALEELLA